MRLYDPIDHDEHLLQQCALALVAYTNGQLPQARQAQVLAPYVEPFKLIDSEGKRCFAYLKHDSELWFAFRGTVASLYELKADLKIAIRDDASEYLSQSEEFALRVIQENPNIKTVWVTGHSLGGHIAERLAYKVGQHDTSLQVFAYGFESPGGLQLTSEEKELGNVFTYSITAAPNFVNCSSYRFSTHYHLSLLGGSELSRWGNQISDALISKAAKVVASSAVPSSRASSAFLLPYLSILSGIVGFVQSLVLGLIPKEALPEELSGFLELFGEGKTNDIFSKLDTFFSNVSEDLLLKCKHTFQLHGIEGVVDSLMTYVNHRELTKHMHEIHDRSWPSLTKFLSTKLPHRQLLTTNQKPHLYAHYQIVSPTVITEKTAPLMKLSAVTTSVHKQAKLSEVSRLSIRKEEDTQQIIDRVKELFLEKMMVFPKDMNFEYKQEGKIVFISTSLEKEEVSGVLAEIGDILNKSIDEIQDFDIDDALKVTAKSTFHAKKLREFFEKIALDVLLRETNQVSMNA